MAPRPFLRNVVDVLDRVELHPDFEPRQHYTVKVSSSDQEPGAGTPSATDPDDIEF